MDQHRDKLTLSPDERRALADIWSTLAAEDPRLARRLHGRRWSGLIWYGVAAVLVASGLVGILASPTTSVLLKTMGVVSYAAGMITIVELRSRRMTGRTG